MSKRKAFAVRSKCDKSPCRDSAPVFMTDLEKVVQKSLLKLKRHCKNKDSQKFIAVLKQSGFGYLVCAFGKTFADQRSSFLVLDFDDSARAPTLRVTTHLWAGADLTALLLRTLPLVVHYVAKQLCVLGEYRRASEVVSSYLQGLQKWSKSRVSQLELVAAQFGTGSFAKTKSKLLHLLGKCFLKTLHVSEAKKMFLVALETAPPTENSGKAAHKLQTHRLLTFQELATTRTKRVFVPYRRLFANSAFFFFAVLSASFSDAAGKRQKHFVPKKFSVDSWSDLALLAEFFVEQQKYHCAYTLLQHLVLRNEKSKKAYPLLALCLAAFENRRELNRLAEDACVLFGDSHPAALFCCATNFWANKNKESAVSTMLKATLQDNSNATAWESLGHLYAQTKESERAVAAFEQAFRIHKGNEKLFLYIAKEHANNHELQKAEVFLQAFVENASNEDHPDFLHLRAALNYKMKNYKEALRQYSAAQEKNELLEKKLRNFVKSFVVFEHEFFETQFLEGSPESLKKELIVEFEKDSREFFSKKAFVTNFNKAFCFKRLDLLDEANFLLKKACKDCKNNFYFIKLQIALGLINYLNKNFDEAIRHLDKVILIEESTKLLKNLTENKFENRFIGRNFIETGLIHDLSNNQNNSVSIANIYSGERDLFSNIFSAKKLLEMAMKEKNKQNLNFDI